MDLSLVGKVITTHGIKGELKIKDASDFDRFYPGAKLYIEQPSSKDEVTVKSVRDYKDSILVVFENLEDINLVLKYRGCNIYVDREGLDELEENEYYYSMLVGKKVVNQAKQEKGIVESIREVPQGELLEVRTSEGKLALVPFRKEFIIDVTDDEIIINEIEGLF